MKCEYMNREEIISWLLTSDPAIKWQVMRDLLDAEEPTYTLERERLTQEGWAAKLLGLQDKDGLWNKSLYNGKWVSTTYTLYLLKVLGLQPFNSQALAGCDQLFMKGIYKGQEIRFSNNQKIQDLGVTGLVLLIFCFFGYHQEEIHKITEYLLNQQCGEGNWLPDGSPASKTYTFETTLIILEALLQYQWRYMSHGSILINAQLKGQEFLLRHNLYLDNGKPVKKKWTTFSFPSYWFYDVLTALDYFQMFKKNRDKRLQAGIDLVMEKQNRAGTWSMGSRHPGKTYFDMEPEKGPGRWNTLRAMRVLKWWETGRFPQ
jgi:hypothetical protein